MEARVLAQTSRTSEMNSCKLDVENLSSGSPHPPDRGVSRTRGDSFGHLRDQRSIVGAGSARRASDVVAVRSTCHVYTLCHRIFHRSIRSGSTAQLPGGSSDDSARLSGGLPGLPVATTSTRTASGEGKTELTNGGRVVASSTSFGSSPRLRGSACTTKRFGRHCESHSG